jgi:hypothetical protein
MEEGYIHSTRQHPRRWGAAEYGAPGMAGTFSIEEKIALPESAGNGNAVLSTLAVRVAAVLYSER